MSDHDLHSELLEVAVDAARAAGAELMARWRRPIKFDTKSTPTDPVSEADLAADRAIHALLAERRPDDSILSEEGSGEQAAGFGASGLRWVVDPLDGTVNYLYGLTAFAVSVAVEDTDGALAGAVLVPAERELFTATRGGPALSNGEPIAPGGCERLDRALVGTGFAYDARVRAAQAQIATRVIPAARDIRRAGAAAVDMCSCACGRLDAYFERGVKPWDVAAGTLICERVGLTVRELEPDGEMPSGVLVAPAALLGPLGALVG